MINNNDDIDISIDDDPELKLQADEARQKQQAERARIRTEIVSYKADEYIIKLLQRGHYHVNSIDDVIEILTTEDEYGPRGELKTNITRDYCRQYLDSILQSRKTIREYAIAHTDERGNAGLLNALKKLIPRLTEILETKPPMAEPEPDKLAMLTARRVLTSENPVEYIIRTWNKDYKENLYYGKSLTFSAYCGSCINTSGLNPAADGKSGGGKTFAQKNMANLLSVKFIRKGLVTAKSGFYHTWPRGTTIQLDDVGKMDDTLAMMYKVSCSNYQSGFIQDTVSKDREGETLIFPQAVNWWLTGVNIGQFDEQILNRNVKIGLDENNKVKSDEHASKVINHHIHDSGMGRPAMYVDADVLVCRAMHDIIMSEPPVNVITPWTDDGNTDEEKAHYFLKWTDKDNLRLPIQFLDMVRVHASINRYQRQVVQTDFGVCVVATLDDYKAAKSVWSMIEREQVTKMTKADSAFIEALKDALKDARKKEKDPWIDIYTMEEKTGKAYNTIYDRVMGVKSKGIEPLTTRYPALRVREENVTQFDVKIEDNFYGERERKTGSRGRKRLIMKIAEDDNIFGSVVILDEEGATKRLEEFMASHPEAHPYTPPKASS